MEALFDRVGGDSFLMALVERFYLGVVGDPLLRPLYPEDLTRFRRSIWPSFWSQYWGGPPTYNEVRGHPRLRMRHVPFVTGPAERDAWLRHSSRTRVGHMVDTGALGAPPQPMPSSWGPTSLMAANSLVKPPDQSGKRGHAPPSGRHRLLEVAGEVRTKSWTDPRRPCATGGWRRPGCSRAGAW